jgi:hypothetical protein
MFSTKNVDAVLEFKLSANFLTEVDKLWAKQGVGWKLEESS